MSIMASHRFRNNGNNNNGGRSLYRRSRSRSRSRDRGRDQNYRNNRRKSSSRSRDRGGYRIDIDNDNKNLNGNNSHGMNNNPSSKFRSRGQDDDYMDDRRVSKRKRDRDRERDYDNRDARNRYRDDGGDFGDNKRCDGPDGNKNNNNYNNRRYNNVDNDHYDRDESDKGDENSLHNYSSTNHPQIPSNTIIVLGLQSHISEADIMSLLIQAEIPPTFIRVIRKRTSGGFAFVEFNTTEEAAQWMEYTQGALKLSESCHATLQYSLLKDWHCGKCGLLNLKRRENCFKCHASRDDSQSTHMDDDLKGKPKGTNGNNSYFGKYGVNNLKRRDSCFQCGDGNDGKVYPIPDVSLNEASGRSYDPKTVHHYDAHSQYYNNETGPHLYRDQHKSTYVLATPAADAATVKAAVKQDSGSTMSNSPVQGDKVKVAKKIVKDMEKWAKKLNQKKDYKPMAEPQPILASGRSEELRPSTSVGGLGGLSSSYVDIGFSMLEKKPTNKLATNYMSPMTLAATNKLIPSYGSDSDDEVAPPPPKMTLASVTETSEKDYVDFQKLTCLLCKRTFKFLELLHRHLNMSNLHKENLAKHNLARSAVRKDGLTTQTETDQETALAAALAYRDEKMGWSKGQPRYDYKTYINKVVKSRYETV